MTIIQKNLLMTTTNIVHQAFLRILQNYYFFKYKSSFHLDDADNIDGQNLQIGNGKHRGQIYIHDICG